MTGKDELTLFRPQFSKDCNGASDRAALDEGGQLSSAPQVRSKRHSPSRSRSNASRGSRRSGRLSGCRIRGQCGQPFTVAEIQPEKQERHRTASRHVDLGPVSLPGQQVIEMATPPGRVLAAADALGLGGVEYFSMRPRTRDAVSALLVQMGFRTPTMSFSRDGIDGLVPSGAA